MIDCRHARNLFEAYVNEELSSSLTTEVDAHRLECRDCNQELAMMEACGNVVRLDTSEPRVSGDFTDRLLAIMTEHESRRSVQLRRGMKLACGLLGVAAAIALLVVWYSEPSTVPGDSEIAGRNYAGPEAEQSISESFSNALLGVSVGRMMDATSRFGSVSEVGRLLINTMGGENRADIPIDDYHLVPTPTQPEPVAPQLDLLDTLPQPDDGGELL